MVDDKSLDSTSDNTTDFEQHKRRHVKPRKKDVQTNTEQLQHSFFDDLGRILWTFQLNSSFQSYPMFRIKFSKTIESD